MIIEIEQIIDALRGVQDPDLHRDLVSLHMIKDVVVEDGGKVSFTVELTTPACPLKAKIESDCRRAVEAVPGVSSVQIHMSARVRPHAGLQKQQALPGVRHIIAVASGKGGVGKSTVSANIACALAKTGAKTGILDADIYGPSIPLIMGVQDEHVGVDKERQQIIPVERYGVKIVSMGFLQRATDAVIWRGPMVAKAVEQFLKDVQWGDLDYLVVDLPPGTGDAQITLTQSIPLTGAVVVMTPQDVAASVALKAIAMFEKMNVNVFGIIENMSYFICPSCSARHEIFSHGGGHKAASDLETAFLGEIPLDIEIRSDSDSGAPSVVSAPESPRAAAFEEVVGNIARQISILTANAPIPLKTA
jgi:ATP-binding protein involved in chromosome partitioning